MVHRNTGPGASIIDDDLNNYRDALREMRVSRLSVRWGGPGAPFQSVGTLFGGMMGYGLALEDDGELLHSPSPWWWGYSPHLRGVHDAGSIYPEYADTYADFKVVGVQTELLLSPYDRQGNPCEFKIHRSGLNDEAAAAFDVGVGFGAAGDFVKVTDAVMDHSNAAALGLSPSEYARNFWELTIIKGQVYNEYLEDWNWFERAQGANSSHFDPPLDL